MPNLRGERKWGEKFLWEEQKGFFRKDKWAFMGDKIVCDNVCLRK